MPRRRLPSRDLRVVRLRSVRLEAALPTGAAKPNPDWIQIAAEGEYKGYAGGAQPFSLDAAVFAVIVRNFRAHPAYVPNPTDDVIASGGADVVPFDFSHASEGDPAGIAVDGAPAQAWALELDVRQGEQGAELWALTRFLEPMISYRAEGRYKWTSVCVWPESVDPRSGASVGWTLSSVAFTNDPFIQGMVPIAASRGFDPYCAPCTPDEVLEALRELFEIPALSPPDEIIASLAKLRSYASGSTAAPAGVEVDEMVGTLRRIFNLPTLASVGEVFAQADALLVALGNASPVPTITASRKDALDMDSFKTACIALAARLRVKLPEKEDTIAAFLCEAVDGAITEAGKTNNDALEQLRAMLTAIGEPDVEAALARITELIQTAARLKEAMPALAELETMKATAEAASTEADVEMAMTFRGLTPEARPALLELRRMSKARFDELYPKPTDEQLKLSRKATPAHAQRAGSALTATAAAGVPKLPDGTVPTREMFEAAEGPKSNPTMRGQNLVRTHLGSVKLSREAIFDLGVKVARHFVQPDSARHVNAI